MGTKEGTIEVVTPLIAMHKAEIIRLGLELNAPLTPYDRKTFYGGDAKGYTDYPTL